MIYGVWNLCMFILALLQPHGSIFVWVSTCGMMACVGGICNLIPSMVGTIFGRWDFTMSNSVIGFIIGLLISSAFAIPALFLANGLGFDAMYISSAIVVVVCMIIIGKTNDAGLALCIAALILCHMAHTTCKNRS